MEPQGTKGRYPETREGDAGPHPIEEAITGCAGLTDIVIINPLVVSGTEETVALAGILVFIDTFGGLGISTGLWFCFLVPICGTAAPSTSACTWTWRGIRLGPKAIGRWEAPRHRTGPRY